MAAKSFQNPIIPIGKPCISLEEVEKSRGGERENQRKGRWENIKKISV